MTVFFTSDHHFYHQNIIRLADRPFDDMVSMHECMIRLWNETVQPDDVVFHLGDFSWNYQRTPHILSQLNGRKILIAGNHDGKVLKQLHDQSMENLPYIYWVSGKQYRYRVSGKQSYGHIQFYLDAGFESVSAMESVFIRNHPPKLFINSLWIDNDMTQVLLSHFPYRNENDPDQRYQEYRLHKSDAWLLHGHVHEKWLMRGNQINVSVERWGYKPVSEGQIAELIQQYPDGVNL